MILPAVSCSQSPLLSQDADKNRRVTVGRRSTLTIIGSYFLLLLLIDQQRLYNDIGGTEVGMCFSKCDLVPFSYKERVSVKAYFGQEWGSVAIQLTKQKNEMSWDELDQRVKTKESSQQVLSTSGISFPFQLAPDDADWKYGKVKYNVQSCLPNTKWLFGEYKR